MALAYLEPDQGHQLDVIISLLVLLCNAWGHKLELKQFIPPERLEGEQILTPEAMAKKWQDQVGGE